MPKDNTGRFFKCDCILSTEVKLNAEDQMLFCNYAFASCRSQRSRSQKMLVSDELNVLLWQMFLSNLISIDLSI